MALEDKDIYKGSGDPLKSVRESFEKLSKELEDTKKSLREIADIYSNELSRASASLNNNSNFADVDRVNRYNQALQDTNRRTQQLTEEERQLNRIQQQIARTQAQTTEEYQDLNRELIRQREALNANNRVLRQQARLQDSAPDSLNRQRAELSRLTNEYNNASSAVRQRMIPQIRALRDEVARSEQAIGNHTRDVGNYQKVWGGLTTIWFKATGVITGIAMIARGIGKLISISMNFDKQMSKVKAVSGATAEQFEELRKQAIKLGGSTAYTATNVAQLQEELARLGFTTSEIIASSEAILQLGAATDESLSDVASVVGSTVRAFQLSAGESGRVADVMAMSFSRSALSLENYTESMKLVAPIASKANVSVETTTALLGELANVGLKGSIAGTGLKNVLSKLSDENSKLSREVGFAVKNDNDLIRALEVMRDKHINLTQATELTDERSKAAFLTLTSGIDKIKGLSDELDNATGSAKEMAETMQDNLAGSITKAGSAWEKMILSVDSGHSKFSLALRGIVDAFAELFDFLGDKASDDPMALIKSMNEDLIRSDKELKDDIVILTEAFEGINSTKSAYMLALEDELAMIDDIKQSYTDEKDLLIEKDNYSEKELRKLKVKIWVQEEERKKVEALIESEKNRIKLMKEQEEIEKEAKRQERLKKEAEAYKELKKEIDDISKMNDKYFKTRYKQIPVEEKHIELEGISTDLAERANKALNERFSTIGRLKKGFSDLSEFMQDNSENFQDVSDSLYNVNDIYTNLTAEKFQQSQEKIDIYNTRIQDLESKMTASLEDQAEGRANTADAEIEQINKLKAERAKAVAEQARITRIQNALAKSAQVAQIGVAVAQIFATNTKIPIVGYIKAISEIALMMSTLLSSKAQAQNFADGGEVHGAGTETSDSIPANLSNGEFVTKAKSYKNAKKLSNMINDGILTDENAEQALRLNINTDSYSSHEHVKANTKAMQHLTSTLLNSNRTSPSKWNRIVRRNGVRI